LKYLGLFICTLAGLLTFSRTFIVLWLLINLISIFVDKRNLTNFMVGIGALILVFSFAAVLQVNTVRLSALNNLIENKSSSSVSAINEGSRTETWSQYYDMINKRPFFGNGYNALSGSELNKVGVHNSYLLVIGEAGIIPFLLMVGIYVMLLFKSLHYFYTNSEYLYLSIALALILMVTHTYFTNYIVIFISIWLYFQVKDETSSFIINNK
jgi:O-antigen ligase